MSTKANHSEPTDQIRYLKKIKEEGKKRAYIYAAYLVLILIAFTLHIKGIVERNFSAENVKKTVEQKLAAVEPLLPLYFNRLVQGVPEAYIVAFADEVSQRGPQIMHALMGDLISVKDRFGSELSNSWRSHNAKNKLAAQIDKIGLDAQSAADINQHLKGEMDEMVQKQLTMAVSLYEDDIAELQTILNSFPRDAQASQSPQEAAKTMIHHMLNLFDEEIMKM